MSSIQALREQKNALSKEANNLLANKGDQIWTKEDQAKFDALGDQIELVNAQIEAHQKAADEFVEKNFTDATRKSTKEQNDSEKALNIFLRKNSKHVTADELALIQNTMSTTTGSEGGFTVDTVIAKSLIETIKDFGAMRRNAQQIITSTGVDLSYPTTDGTAEEGEIIAQNVSATDLDIVFGTVGLNVFKFSSKVVTVPIELLQDANIDVQALVFKRLGERIGRIQNRLFTVGTGTGQPNGLANAAAVGKTGTTGQTTTVIYDDLVDLQDSIDVAYLESINAKWMFSQTVRRTVRKIKDTAGRPIWTPSYDAGFSANTPDLLLGSPVEINNHMPAPAANAKSIAYGNLNSYIVRDAMDLTLFKFDDSAFLKKGQFGFLAWARAGGNLPDLAGVKTYQHSAT